MTPYADWKNSHMSLNQWFQWFYRSQWLRIIRFGQADRHWLSLGRLLLSLPLQSQQLVFSNFIFHHRILHPWKDDD